MLYGTPKKIPDGRYYLKCTGEDGTSRVMVQLNNVVMSSSEDSSVLLELPNTSKIDSVDAENLEAAKANSTEWFGKELNEKTLETAYQSSLKNNTMNINKATVSGQVVTKFYNHDKTLIEDLTILEGSEVRCDVMLEFSGLWFMKKTYGPIWRLAQVKLKAPPKKVYPEECLFEDQEDVETPEEQDGDYI